MFLVLLVAVSVSVTATLDYYNSLGLRLAGDNEACRSSLLLHHWLLHAGLHHWLHSWLHHWLHTWLHHRLHAGLHHRLLHSWLHHLLLGCLLRLGLTLSGGLEHTLDVDLS